MLVWDSSLSVGVAEIDNQHKKLIKLINDLNDSMREGKSKEALGKIINELLDYTRTHFSYEENLFNKYNYPDTEQHLKAHRSFEGKISSFKNDFSTGKIGVSIEILNYLNEWLKRHILGTDTKYTKFLNDNGVS